MSYVCRRVCEMVGSRVGPASHDHTPATTLLKQRHPLYLWGAFESRRQQQQSSGPSSCFFKEEEKCGLQRGVSCRQISNVPTLAHVLAGLRGAPLQDMLHGSD